MILLIDNYDSFTYNLYQLVCNLGYETTVVRNDKITIDEITKMNPAAIILSPGPGHPNQAKLCSQIVTKLSRNIPILGVCLGMQVIVQEFGGIVDQEAEPIHGESSLITHNNSPLFINCPNPMEVGRYHSLSANTKTIPNCLDITAQTDEGLIMAVKHESRPCYGVQFHPESVLTPDGPLLVKEFLKIAHEVQS